MTVSASGPQGAAATAPASTVWIAAGTVLVVAGIYVFSKASRRDTVPNKE